MVFETYTQQGLSINAIARLLNERQIGTRTGKGRWERSTVWGMLRNPAYRGTACYGKTEQRPRQRVTRPCVSEKPCRVATLVVMNGLGQSGLRCLCLRW
jgi:hypothetical protein